MGLQHLRISSFLSYSFHALEFISKKLVSNSCLHVIVCELDYFESAFIGSFFPRELREANMRSRTSLLVAGLSLLSSKESKTTILVGVMDITRLMIHLQQVEKDKLRSKKSLRTRELRRQGIS